MKTKNESNDLRLDRRNERKINMKTAKEMREITLEARETLLDKKLYELSRSILFKANNGETRYEYLMGGEFPKAFGKELALEIKEELVEKGYTVVLTKPSLFSKYKYYSFDIRW